MFLVYFFGVVCIPVCSDMVAVTSAAPSKSNQKATNKQSYYETLIIYEDVVEEKIREVRKKQLVLKNRLITRTYYF